ncbi:MAG: response regulator transcription factor [Chloroflexi bacterium]|nr:response regulator transcription factor [Chloroflexota bacterium]MBI3176941.1 response regulator transcription factor [Chloroflexota bacterium]
MAKPIRVLIADDHTIVRAGVRLLLEAEPDMEVVGEALTGDEAVVAAESLKPNVILMDISMPGLNGMEATGKIKARFPEIQVLVLTMHRSDEYFFEVLKAGASGYVLKGAETNELIGAIRAVARGEVFLYPTMAKQLLRDYLSRVKGLENPALPALTAREKEILHLLADGYSNKEIAERLVVSPSTIHSHHSNLMKKLNLNSRHELIRFARERGLLRDS